MPPHVYDIHAHYYPDFYVRSLEATGWLPTDAAERAIITGWSIEQHLEFMAANGIRKTCFSPAYPGATVYAPSRRNNRRNARLARRLNNYGHELAQQYPDRVSYLAVLPFPSEALCCKEIVRLERKLGSCTGYCLFTETWGIQLHDPKVASVLEWILAAPCAVFLHPHHSCTDVEQAARTSAAALAQLLTHSFVEIGVDTLCTIVAPALPPRFPALLASFVNFTRLLSFPSPFQVHADREGLDRYEGPAIMTRDVGTAMVPVLDRIIFFDLTTAGPNAFQSHVPTMLNLGIDHSRLLLGSAAPCGGWDRAAALLDALSTGAQNYWGIEAGAEECQAVRVRNARELETWR